MGRFEDILEKEGRLIYRIKGVSMLPMLRQNSDIVVIERARGKLKKYDVALYRRGPDYVLHRVIRVTDWGYLIRGDNTYALEKVPSDAVIGVLTAFVRGGKTRRVTDPGVRAYTWVWHAIYPLRVFCLKVRRRLGRLARKLGLRRG